MEDRTYRVIKLAGGARPWTVVRDGDREHRAAFAFRSREAAVHRATQLNAGREPVVEEA